MATGVVQSHVVLVHVPYLYIALALPSLLMNRFCNYNNTKAFFGSSVQNLTYYDKFPNGGPLWLSMESVVPGDGILIEGVTLGEVWITEGEFLCYTYDNHMARSE